MVINQKTFINKLSEKSNYSRSECDEFFKYFVAVLCDSLKNGDEIKCRGIFSISTKIRKYYDMRKGVNGETVCVPTIQFGEQLKDAAKMFGSASKEDMN